MVLNNIFNPIYESESEDRTTPVCKSFGIGNNIFNPIYESGDKITPDIHPKCGYMHWPSPENSNKI